VSGTWQNWLGEEAFYQPHEQELMARIKENREGEELEVVHLFKALFDARIDR
jgi:hypothetical protein